VKEQGPIFSVQAVKVKIGPKLLPLLIDTGSSLSLIKRRCVTSEIERSTEGTPLAVSASGEEIAIFGRAFTNIKFVILEGQYYQHLVAFWVIADHQLPGVAGLLGSDVLSQNRAIIDMGDNILNFAGLRIRMEDAPLATAEIAQQLFPITEIKINVHSKVLRNDHENDSIKLDSHVLVEPEIVLADRNVRVASLKTSVAGRNTREADRNVRVARVKTCIADGNIRVADSNISAEDARLIGFENKELLNQNMRTFGATVAQLPGTSCCDELLNRNTRNFGETVAQLPGTSCCDELLNRNKEILVRPLPNFRERVVAMNC